MIVRVIRAWRTEEDSSQGQAWLAAVQGLVTARWQKATFNNIHTLQLCDETQMKIKRVSVSNRKRFHIVRYILCG